MKEDVLTKNQAADALDIPTLIARLDFFRKTTIYL
jgi:hypothetical protein